MLSCTDSIIPGYPSHSSTPPTHSSTCPPPSPPALAVHCARAVVLPREVGVPSEFVQRASRYYRDCRPPGSVTWKVAIFVVLPAVMTTDSDPTDQDASSSTPISPQNAILEDLANRLGRSNQLVIIIIHKRLSLPIQIPNIYNQPANQETGEP
jgi:hypothetical protein